MCRPRCPTSRAATAQPHWSAGCCCARSATPSTPCLPICWTKRPCSTWPPARWPPLKTPWPRRTIRERPPHHWLLCHRHRHGRGQDRSEEHTSELQSPCNLVCRLLLEKKKNKTDTLASDRADLV